MNLIYYSRYWASRIRASLVYRSHKALRALYVRRIAASKPMRPVTYLAYPEQIPPDEPVFLLGEEPMLSWMERLLTSRGYKPQPVGHPLWYKNGGSLVVVSASRDAYEQQFGRELTIYHGNELYDFVHAFAQEHDILLDDLAMTYAKVPLEQSARYGKTWRSVPRLDTHTYVRNIENAVGPGTKYVINVGCHDGISGDPCYPLYRDGWTGLAIDGVAAEHDTGLASAKTFQSLPHVKLLLGTYLTPDNTEATLRGSGAPLDCDLIKVDIDSYDGPVIQAIVDAGYRPRVFCVEVNADLPPPFQFTVDYTADDNGPDPQAGIYGCSVAWVANLLGKCGYRFARYDFGFPHMIGGIRDMIFIREDVFDVSGARPADWVDAYYAEPLGWSHMKSGLAIDPRQWRHCADPAATASEMRDLLAKASFARTMRHIPFRLTA